MTTPAAGRVLGRLAGIGALLLFLGVLGKVLHAAQERPALTYDMLDYMALTLAWEIEDPVELHRRTYEIAEAELPSEAYADLVKGRFRETMRADPAKFAENLAIHRGRVLYTLAVYLVYKLGAPLHSATLWVSQAFFVSSVLFLLAWLLRHLPLAPAALVALALMLSPPVLSLAPTSMTDSMTLFAILLGTYAWIERGALRTAAAILTFSILVRPEIVILIFASVAALVLMVDVERRPSRRFLATWAAISVALFLLVRIVFDDPGWWPVFLISFLGRGDGTLEALPGFDLGRYLSILKTEAADLFYAGYFIVGPIVNGSTFMLAFAGFAVAALAFGARSPAARETQHHRALLCALMLSCSIRYLLFPYLWDRYYVHFMVLVPVLLLAMVSIELRRSRAGALGTV